jgi:hypothetical protein
MNRRDRRHGRHQVSWSSFDDSFDEPLDEELSQVRRNPVRWQRSSLISGEVDDRPQGVPRLRFRNAAWRFIGALAIGAAFYGVARVGTHAEARRAIMEWVTLGHAEKVQSVKRTLDNWVESVRREWAPPPAR